MTYKYENCIKKSQSDQTLQYSKGNASQREWVGELYLQFEKILLFLCAHVLLCHRTSRKYLGHLLAWEYVKNWCVYYLFVTNILFWKQNSFFCIFASILFLITWPVLWRFRIYFLFFIIIYLRQKRVKIWSESDKWF